MIDVTVTDILEAAERLKGQANRTPLFTNHVLNDLTGANVFIKPECLQVTGSFKFRGAFNAIATLTDAERKAGIVAESSGNHAQGIAEAARRFGVSATIVMPSDAPAIKVARTKRSGAEVVFYDRATQNREVISREIVADTGRTLVHPFNNRFVIAGQGTTGLEIAEDLAELREKPDHVLVCTGGGGLTAGVALAVCQRFPEVLVHTVEPEGFDDYSRSLKAGQIIANDKTAGSLCDALLSLAPGEIGFGINKGRLSDGYTVSDAEALDAMKFAFEELKLVTEPGGAVALAALLSAKRKFAGQTVVIVISGGNADPDVFHKAISN